VELLGETPVLLSASATLKESQLLVYTTLVCQVSSYTPAPLGSTTRSMKLLQMRIAALSSHKRSQLLIRTHDETVSVTMRVNNPD
jgi:hypothetical protein